MSEDAPPCTGGVQTATSRGDVGRTVHPAASPGEPPPIQAEAIDRPHERYRGAYGRNEARTVT